MRDNSAAKDSEKEDRLGGLVGSWHDAKDCGSQWLTGPKDGEMDGECEADGPTDMIRDANGDS